MNKKRKSNRKSKSSKNSLISLFIIVILVLLLLGLTRETTSKEVKLEFAKPPNLGLSEIRYLLDKHNLLLIELVGNSQNKVLFISEKFVTEVSKKCHSGSYVVEKTNKNSTTLRSLGDYKIYVIKVNLSLKRGSVLLVDDTIKINTQLTF